MSLLPPEPGHVRVGGRRHVVVVHLALVVAVLIGGIASAVAMQPDGQRRSSPRVPSALARPPLPIPRVPATPVTRPHPARAARPAAAPGFGSRPRHCPGAARGAPGDVVNASSQTGGPGVVSPADRWAVLIGIQHYAGSTHPTLGGRGDVTAIRTALLRSGWRSDHILSLIDCQASQTAIIDAMTWLADRSGPSTFSLFHYSGHACIASRGPCRAGHTYLWSQDNGFISEGTVGTLLGRVQGPAWFDFAACEAGAFDAGLSSASRLVTGSSQASETAYEVPEWKESVWTGLVWDRAFLQSQHGSASDDVTLGQMVRYGRAHAPEVTAGQARGPQHPYAAGGDPTQTLDAPHS